MRAAAIDHRNSSVGHARVAVHRGAELRQEVLHDDLLHMAVLEVGIRDRDQGVDALGARLADADEDARRERHARPSGGVQCREAALRGLVGRAVVRATGLTQPGRERLDHHSLRGADRAQDAELLLGERARVGVRQQAGLVEHTLGDRGEVLDGRAVALRPEPLGGLRIARLGRLAEREQRLEAPERGAARGQLQHVVGRQVGGVQPGRRLGERAVSAPIAAQHRERDEHLGRERDAPPETGIAPGRGVRHQRNEWAVEQLPELRRSAHDGDPSLSARPISLDT